jgi:capsular polysaccharide transport system permease protein
MTAQASGRFMPGLKVQIRTIKALIVRDIMLRYGRNNIGFLWVILEPMILTIGVLFLFSIVKSSHEHGTHVLSMVLTGYMPLTLWRHTTNQGIFLLRRSYSTLFHRNVTLLDVFLARMILEGLGTTAALIAVYLLLWSAGVVDTIAKPGHLIAAWLLLWWLGMSVTLLVAVLTEVNETSERFIQPAQYLIVPLSGIFYMVDWLPDRAQDIIWYNPLSTCIEFFRDGYFGEAVTTHYDPLVPLAWALALTWLGLTLIAKARNNMVAA